MSKQFESRILAVLCVFSGSYNWQVRHFFMIIQRPLVMLTYWHDSNWRDIIQYVCQSYHSWSTGFPILSRSLFLIGAGWGGLNYSHKLCTHLVPFIGRDDSLPQIFPSYCSCHISRDPRERGFHGNAVSWPVQEEIKTTGKSDKGLILCESLSLLVPRCRSNIVWTETFDFSSVAVNTTHGFSVTTMLQPELIQTLYG